MIFNKIQIDRKFRENIKLTVEDVQFEDKEFLDSDENFKGSHFNDLEELFFLRRFSEYADKEINGRNRLTSSKINLYSFNEMKSINRGLTCKDDEVFVHNNISESGFSKTDRYFSKLNGLENKIFKNEAYDDSSAAILDSVCGREFVTDEVLLNLFDGDEKMNYKSDFERYNTTSIYYYLMYELGMNFTQLKIHLNTQGLRSHLQEFAPAYKKNSLTRLARNYFS